MKRFDYNKKYMEIGAYVVAVVACVFLLAMVMFNISDIFGQILSCFSIAYTILKPFITGLFIAYFLNPAMRFIEKNILLRLGFLRKRLKLARMIAVAMTYLILISMIVWALWYLIPEIAQNINSMIDSINRNRKDIESYFNSFDLVETINSTFSINLNWDEILTGITSQIHSIINTIPSTVPSIVGTLYKGTMTFVSIFVNIGISLVVAFYMLCSKEFFASAITKFFKTFVKRSTTERIFSVAKLSHRMIERFFVGKLIDSLAVAIIFYIIISFMNVPYALLLSIILGITNMIPFFGPMVGGAIVTFIVFFSTIYIPDKMFLSLWVFIVISILFQIDGNILEPKILGDFVGVSPISVLFSIIVGGALFGVAGMFFGVPVFAVIRTLIGDYVNKKYEKRYYIAPDETMSEIRGQE